MYFVCVFVYDHVNWKRSSNSIWMLKMEHLSGTHVDWKRYKVFEVIRSETMANKNDGEWNDNRNFVVSRMHELLICDVMS